MRVLVFILSISFIPLLGQQHVRTTIGGELVTMLIQDGDTIIVADLGDVTVTSPRKFGNTEDYLRYMRYRRYAAQVYPYAVEAIRIYRQIKEETEGLKNRKRRKYSRQLQKELQYEYKEPLKNLTKTQGKILVKMIERELEIPFYFLVKEFRGGFTATYWNSIGSLYGYHLKDGYLKGEDTILDAVLEDFDITAPIKEE